MTRGRAVPPQPPSRRAQEHAERRAVLLSLDLAQVRAWAMRWSVPLLPASDEALLVSMHEARMRDEGMPPAARLLSARWLAERGDPIALAAFKEREMQDDLA